MLRVRTDGQHDPGWGLHGIRAQTIAFARVGCASFRRRSTIALWIRGPSLHSRTPPTAGASPQSNGCRKPIAGDASIHGGPAEARYAKHLAHAQEGRGQGSRLRAGRRLHWCSRCEINHGGLAAESACRFHMPLAKCADAKHGCRAWIRHNDAQRTGSASSTREPLTCTSRRVGLDASISPGSVRLNLDPQGASDADASGEPRRGH
jgi:hypothetical protein